MKLRTRFSVLLIVFVIIASVLFWNIIVSQKNAKEVEARRLQIGQSLQDIFELNLLTNEFILHPNKRIIQQWQMNYHQLEDDLKTAFSDRRQTSKMKQLQKKIKSNYEFVGSNFSDLLELPAQDELYDLYIDKIFLKSVDMVYLIFDYKQELYNKAILANKYHSNAVLFGLTIILLMALGVFYSFINQVLKPLRKFRKDLKIIGNGDLDHRIELTRKDEIGQLAVSFNEMIDDLKKTISSRDELNTQMEEIKRMEKERENLMEKLQDSNKQLENFAYVASHDLQEPLRKMISFSGLLAKHLGNDLDEKGLKFMNYITSGAERMQKLILDLLSFSRIETRGKDPETTDMNQLLEHVQNELSILIAENDAVINIEKLPKMKVDGSQMFMVLQNLINNGIKFRGDKTPEINIKCKEKGDNWLISVADNGIGIDPEFSDKIFVIFQRLHSASQYPGTGIGLALVKKIIERHNGKIWVESEPGKGSTFFIELPKEV